MTDAPKWIYCVVGERGRAVATRETRHAAVGVKALLDRLTVDETDLRIEPRKGL